MSQPAKKSAGSWTGTLWAALVGYLCYQYFAHGTLPFNAHSWLSRKGPESNQEATGKKSREVLRFTAGELFNAYQANEVATDLRLKDKDVLVVGRVESINKNAWNTIFVSLQTPNQFMPANMHLDDAQTKDAAALVKGQRVEIKCKSFTLWVGSPTGRECRLISSQ